MIKNLFVRNFKCFLEQHFSFASVNFFVGTNSVGKSSVLQALLLPFQSDNLSILNFNGDLVSIGEYIDVLNKKATDDAIQVSMNMDNKEYSWGYNENYTVNLVSNLPASLPIRTDNELNLDKFKNKFQFLSAERWGPRDYVPVQRNHRFGWVGKHGEHTIEYLYTLFNESSSTNLLDSDNRKHPNAVNSTLIASIEAWLGEISPGVSLGVKAFREASIGWSLFGYGDENPNYKAVNVGFGLSYVLGIITALVSANPGDIIFIENPEAHLHPRGQSILGRLLALTGHAGIQLFVETHSEHIINGARIAILQKLLNHENMKIFFFDKNDNSTPNVACITSDDRGALNSWPRGFFDQAEIDMAIMIRG